MLTLVGETMDDKFKKFATGLNERKNPSSNENQGKNGPASNKQLYADVVGNQIDPNKDERNQITLQRAKSTQKHVLILEPSATATEDTSDSEETDSEATVKSPLSLINAAISGVNVKFCSVKKSGRVALGCC